MIRESVLNRAFSNHSQKIDIQLDLMERNGDPMPNLPRANRLKKDIGRRIGKRLIDQFGFVILKSSLTVDVYGSGPAHNYSVSLDRQIQRLKKRMGANIYNVPGVGYALAVQRFDLSIQDAATLQIFRENPGRRIKAGDFAELLYEDVDRNRVLNTNAAIERLQAKDAHGKTFEIVSYPGYYGGYEYQEQLKAA